MNELLKSWHCMLLGMSYHMVRSESCDFEALPLFGLGVMPAPVHDAIVAHGAGDGGGMGGEVRCGGQSDDEPQAAPSDDRKSQILRENCNNIVQYVAFLLADPHRNRIIKIITTASWQVFLSHNRAYKGLRSEEYVAKYSRGMSHGSYLRTLRKSRLVLGDKDSLVSMGFKFEYDQSEVLLSGAGVIKHSAAGQFFGLLSRQGQRGAVLLAAVGRLLGGAHRVPDVVLMPRFALLAWDVILVDLAARGRPLRSLALRDACLAGVF